MIKQRPANDGDTVIDLAISIYKDTRAIPSLLTLNPTIDFTTGIVGGTLISYDDSLTFAPVTVPVVPQKIGNPNFITRFGQTIFDLSIQLYGQVSNIGNVLSLFSVLDIAAPVGNSLQSPNSANALAKGLFSKVIVATYSPNLGTTTNDILLEDGIFYVLCEDNLTRLQVT